MDTNKEKIQLKYTFCQIEDLIGEYNSLVRKGIDNDQAVGMALISVESWNCIIQPHIFKTFLESYSSMDPLQLLKISNEFSRNYGKMLC